MSGRYAAPARLNERLARNEYREVYSDRYDASITETKVFVEDPTGDALKAMRPDGQVFDTDVEETAHAPRSMAIRLRMPGSDLGEHMTQQNADVPAHVLRLGRFSTGSMDLPRATGTLNQIVFRRDPSMFAVRPSPQ